MILTRGRVLEVGAGQARVARDAAEACERCAAGQGCGGGLFARLAGTRRHEVLARVAVTGLSPGDEVILGLPESGLLAGAFAVYVVPLAGLLLGAALAGVAFGATSDAAVLASGVAGFAAGIFWLAGYARRVARDPRFEPCVVERAGPGAPRPARPMPPR